nr:MAG TPA: Transcriptional regulator, MarR/EmrR family, emrR, transcriptional regulator, DNA-binding [Bacteriophage sp.]
MSRWDRIQGLTEAQRAVLLALLEADLNGVSAEELRRSCDLSKVIVYRALTELHRQGLARVVAERRLSANGAWFNIWTITPNGVRKVYLIRRDGPRKKQTRWPSRRAAAARKRLAAEGRPFGSDQYV